MSTGVALIVFVVGLVVSLGASEFLVRGFGRLGTNVGLAAGLVGLLTALGTDAPEISSAVTALLSGAKDVGLGVILQPWQPLAERAVEAIPEIPELHAGHMLD